mgnify:CR=1 FL=1
MLLGMMVVGTSAAAGYSDVDADDNVEAIEVLQAVEVMVGDDRGFGPDRPVTRAEMAVVMGKLLNLGATWLRVMGVLPSEPTPLKMPIWLP